MEPSAFHELCRLLEQETLLFRAIAETELEKRDHILTANGRKLQELTRRTELLLVESQALGGRRSHLSAELLGHSPEAGREVSLGEIVDAAAAAGMERTGHFREVAAGFRSQVSEVQGQVAENDRLLGLAGQSLKRLLTGFQKAAAKTDTYSPKGDEGRRRAQAVILNANA